MQKPTFKQLCYILVVNLRDIVFCKKKYEIFYKIHFKPFLKEDFFMKKETLFCTVIFKKNTVFSTSKENQLYKCKCLF